MVGLGLGLDFGWGYSSAHLKSSVYAILPAAALITAGRLVTIRSVAVEYRLCYLYC